MDLDTVREALRRQVTSPETSRHFDDAKRRRPALRPFDDAVAAVAFLNDTDPGAMAARSAVTRAMLEEVQARRHDCWGAALMVAYFPGLLRIRGSAHRAGCLGREDLDWLVVESFLEVAGSMPLATQGRLAVVNLVLGTRKTVFEQLRRETTRAAAERPWDDDFDLVIPGRSPSPERILIQRETERALTPARIRAWVRSLCGDATEDDVLLVLGTHASGKPLVEWVRERYPDADRREFMGHFERLRRRRSRLLQRLRERIREGALSHPADDPALLQEEVRR